jgi:hypothetical protein
MGDYILYSQWNINHTIYPSILLKIKFIHGLDLRNSTFPSKAVSYLRILNGLKRLKFYSY